MQMSVLVTVEVDDKDASLCGAACPFLSHGDAEEGSYPSCELFGVEGMTEVVLQPRDPDPTITAKRCEVCLRNAYVIQEVT